MALPKYPFISVDDYLTLDRNSREARYEYYDGELQMLAGGSNNHSLVIANLTTILNNSLNDSPCRVYNTDVHLRLSETRYVHPDVTVSCDPHDEETDEMIQYPHLVIEVLSPSTEVVDRGKKFAYYRECRTLQEYVMVDAYKIQIEVYRREDDGWMLHTFGPESNVKLKSLNIEFPIDAVYRKVKLAGSRNNKGKKS